MASLFAVEFCVASRINHANESWTGLHAEAGNVPSYFGALFDSEASAKSKVMALDIKYHPDIVHRVVTSDGANAIRVGDAVEFKAGRLHQHEGHKGWVRGTVTNVRGMGVTVMADYRVAADYSGHFKAMGTEVNIHDIRRAKAPKTEAAAKPKTKAAKAAPAAPVAAPADPLAEYSIVKLKTFNSYHEGPGFTCELHRNGKRVAQVEDMADGGPVNFYWDDARAEPVLTPVYQHGGELKDVPLSPEFSRFMLLARQVLPVDEMTVDGKTVLLHPDHENLISHMVDKIEVVKRVKRVLAREVIVIGAAGHPCSLLQGRGSRAKLKPTPEVLVRARAQYGDKLVNDMPIERAIELLTAE